MRSRFAVICATLLSALLASGCARHVTIPPDMLHLRNQPDWSIRRMPAPPAPSSPAAPAPAASTAAPSAK